MTHAEGLQKLDTMRLQVRHNVYPEYVHAAQALPEVYLAGASDEDVAAACPACERMA